MRYLIFTIVISVSSAAYAEIYKQIDKDGNVIYSDVPFKAKQQPVKVKPMTTFKATPTKKATAPAKKKKEAKEAKATEYKDIAVHKPVEGEAIRANDGNIAVEVSAKPGLDVDEGHKIAVLLDGNIVTKTTTGSVTLENVPRGTHTITAEILDKKDKVLFSSKSGVTFHVLRASVLSPARRGRF